MADLREIGPAKSAPKKKPKAPSQNFTLKRDYRPDEEACLTALARLLSSSKS